MANQGGHRWGRWRVALGAALLAGLSGGGATADEVATFGAWSVFEAELGDTAVTRLPAGEKFGLLCLADSDGCVYFVKPLQDCEDGRRIPVHLGGQAGVWRLNGLCAELETGFLVLFDEDLGELVRGSSSLEAWVRAPAGGGRTLRFDMLGALDAMARARAAHEERRRASGLPLAGARA